MTSTLTHKYTKSLTIIECPSCHMDFGATPEFVQERRDDHKSFYCPCGHIMSYGGRSEAEKLADELAREKRLRGYSEATLTSTRDQLQATKDSLRSHKAAKTRIKNRIAAGVCPCCNRTFQNVAAHMAGQHPDFGHNPEESK